MQTLKQKLGAEGEDLAFTYLEQQGFEMLKTNWRKGRLEVDIIALHRKSLVFIEVKTRKNKRFGNPESAITKSKENRMAEAAEEYLIDNQLDYPVRFDLISVILNEKNLEIEHFEDAFIPGVF